MLDALGHGVFTFGRVKRLLIGYCYDSGGCCSCEWWCTINGDLDLPVCPWSRQVTAQPV